MSTHEWVSVTRIGFSVVPALRTVTLPREAAIRAGPAKHEAGLRRTGAQRAMDERTSAGSLPRRRAQAAPFHLPKGSVGEGRTLPPQMNAAIRGSVRASEGVAPRLPSATTIPCMHPPRAGRGSERVPVSLIPISALRRCSEDLNRMEDAAGGGGPSARPGHSACQKPAEASSHVSTMAYVSCSVRKREGGVSE